MPLGVLPTANNCFDIFTKRQRIYGPTYNNLHVDWTVGAVLVYRFSVFVKVYASVFLSDHVFDIPPIDKLIVGSSCCNRLAEYKIC